MNSRLLQTAPLLVIIAACSVDAEPQAPPRTVIPERERSTEPPVEEETEQLPGAQAAAYMSDLASRDREQGLAALGAVLKAKDKRFIPVLIEVMRGTEVGMFLGTDYITTVASLETLSGESFGANWPDRVEWYGGTELSPPPGFLYRSNKLMYDRQTRTLWNQLTGEPVLGALVGEDIELDLLPVVLTKWEDWLAQHPDTQVLGLETGYDRYYFPGAAYGDYFSSTSTMFPVWRRSEQLDTKDRIYALRVDGTPKAYPLNDLAIDGVVNDRIGETNIVLVAKRGRVMVRGENLRVGQVLYESGGEVRAFDRGEQVFLVSDMPDVVIDSLGRGR